MPYCHNPPSPSCGICKRAAEDPVFARAIAHIPPPKWQQREALGERRHITQKKCGGCSKAPREEAHLVINQGAGGLGDSLLGLLAVGGAARQGRKIAYAVNALTIPFVGMFDGGYDKLLFHDWDDQNGIKDVPPDGHQGDLQLNHGYNRECSARCEEPRWARYCRNAGNVEPVLPRLRDPAMLLDLGKDYKGYVVLSPFSAHPGREYPLQSWLTLERRLVEEGFNIAVLGVDQDRICKFKSERIISADAEKVGSIIYSASCTISNDSGLAHLSGIMGKPTLVLTGQVTGPSIYGAYPKMRYLSGHLDCGGCWWQPPFDNGRCGNNCAALWSISPEEIVNMVKEMSR